MGVVLYEYLGEEYPEVLGSILSALKSIVNVIGMTKMTPPIKDLLPRLTPILKNRSATLPPSPSPHHSNTDSRKDLVNVWHLPRQAVTIDSLGILEENHQAMLRKPHALFGKGSCT